MGTPKISTFIIGIALIGFIIGIFMINLAAFTTQYEVSGYDESNLSIYNKLEELANQSEEVRDESSTINVQDLSFKDIIGGFFSSGYNALVLTFNSVETFLGVYDQGINDANLGQTGTYLRSYLFIAILTTIFIGILISTTVKRES